VKFLSVCSGIEAASVAWRGKTAPDGPRYKALGNSMAVPVMRWIGKGLVTTDAGHLTAG
jgi:site-specific DNA-cytosine methylase